MTIQVNGEAVTLEKSYSIQELLTVLKVEMPQYVTVQLNDKLVAREDFSTTVPGEGDEIEFLYFMGGGAR